MSSSDPSLPGEAPDASVPTDSRGGLQLNAAALAPGLHIVSTPIGNLRDITLRALDTLAAADEILAEDTRQTRRLLDAYGISAKLTAYHDHNGAARRPELIEKLKGGAALALVSDAGTPLVSDPGWKLARDALSAGVKVIPVPGASAMLAGLVASGLPSDQFHFAGFPPAKTGARKDWIAALKTVPATLILYESGPRLTASLEALGAGLSPSRPACVARELTKLFEETRFGTLGELAAHYKEHGPPKGEIVILIGPPERQAATEADMDAALKDALARLPVKAAAQEVSDVLGLPRRDCYQRALALKSGDA